MEKAITACGKCGGLLNGAMKFCPSCGKRISAGRSPRWYAAVASAALGLFAVSFGLQTVIRGDRVPPKIAQPSEDQSSSMEQDVSDPQIVAMRGELEKSPEDLTKLRIFAGILGDKLRSNPGAAPSLVFEAIDIFGRILRLEPNDPTALVMMADVSFDQRAFTKALDFYERYLKIEGDDLGARARYASTLTFLGRYDQSISELNSVLKADPKNFPAMAYLAITYAQRGDVPKAKQVGSTALSLAPSDEARARFSAFVSSLDAAHADSVASDSPQRGAPGASSQEPESSAGGVSGFIQAIKQNPVAGPKFVRYEQTDGKTLQLVFRAFPMNQMPPFAKEKFFGSLRTAAKNNNLTGVERLVFVDELTDSEMETVVLAAQ